MSIASSVYGLAERGYLPDFLVRSGIRRLCAETSRARVAAASKNVRRA